MWTSLMLSMLKLHQNGTPLSLPILLFYSEHKALKKKMQTVKESNIGVKSNKTKGDYHDEAESDAGYGYYEEYEEYGDDYASYYDENSNSADDHLGMFRSAHKGNHLPSINRSSFPCDDFNPFAFSRIFSKGVPGIGCD